MVLRIFNSNHSNTLIRRTCTRPLLRLQRYYVGTTSSSSSSLISSSAYSRPIPAHIHQGPDCVFCKAYAGGGDGGDNDAASTMRSEEEKRGGAVGNPICVDYPHPTAEGDATNRTATIDTDAKRQLDALEALLRAELASAAGSGSGGAVVPSASTSAIAKAPQPLVLLKQLLGESTQHAAVPLTAAAVGNDSNSVVAPDISPMDATKNDISALSRGVNRGAEGDTSYSSPPLPTVPSIAFDLSSAIRRDDAMGSTYHTLLQHPRPATVSTLLEVFLREEEEKEAAAKKLRNGGGDGVVADTTDGNNTTTGGATSTTTTTSSRPSIYYDGPPPKATALPYTRQLYEEALVSHTASAIGAMAVKAYPQGLQSKSMGPTFLYNPPMPVNAEAADATLASITAAERQQRQEELSPFAEHLVVPAPTAVETLLGGAGAPLAGVAAATSTQPAPPSATPMNQSSPASAPLRDLRERFSPLRYDVHNQRYHLDGTVGGKGGQGVPAMTTSLPQELATTDAAHLLHNHPQSQSSSSTSPSHYNNVLLQHFMRCTDSLGIAWSFDWGVQQQRQVGSDGRLIGEGEDDGAVDDGSDTVTWPTPQWDGQIRVAISIAHHMRDRSGMTRGGGNGKDASSATVVPTSTPDSAMIEGLIAKLTAFDDGASTSTDATLPPAAAAHTHQQPNHHHHHHGATVATADMWGNAVGATSDDAWLRYVCEGGFTYCRRGLDDEEWHGDEDRYPDESLATTNHSSPSSHNHHGNSKEGEHAHASDVGGVGGCGSYSHQRHSRLVPRGDKGAYAAIPTDETVSRSLAAGRLARKLPFTTLLGNHAEDTADAIGGGAGAVTREQGVGGSIGDSASGTTSASPTPLTTGGMNEQQPKKPDLFVVVGGDGVFGVDDRSTFKVILMVRGGGNDDGGHDEGVVGGVGGGGERSTSTATKTNPAPKCDDDCTDHDDGIATSPADRLRIAARLEVVVYNKRAA